MRFPPKGGKSSLNIASKKVMETGDICMSEQQIMDIIRVLTCITASNEGH